MTTHSRHSLAPVACGMVVCILLAGCSSSTSASQAITPAPSPTGSSSSSALPASAGTPTPVAASTSTAAAPPAGGNACALVTEHDAAAALGQDPGRGSAFSSHGSTQCQYGTYQTRFILVNLTPVGGRAGYDVVHNHQKPGGSVTVVDIAGVGDRAFEVSGPNTAGIYAGKGDALLVVTVMIRDAPAPPTGPVLALAKLAAGRL